MKNMSIFILFTKLHLSFSNHQFNLEIKYHYLLMLASDYNYDFDESESYQARLKIILNGVHIFWESKMWVTIS